jgi:hypothetical protein
MTIADVTCGVSSGSQIVAAINETKTLAESIARTYWFYANDTATNPAAGGTKITHSAGSLTTFLTNNALGTRTFEHNPDSRADLWNPVTGSFDFSSLKIGDIAILRVDLVIDHAAAQEIRLVMDLAEGSVSPYALNIAHDYFVTATNDVTVTAFFELPFISQPTVDNSARIRFESVVAATIVVEGWYYRVVSS